MKNIFSILLAASILFTTTGFVNAKQICGVDRQSFGVLNDENKHPNVNYDPNWLWIGAAVVLSTTVVVPVYVVGFKLMKPVGNKYKCK